MKISNGVKKQQGSGLIFAVVLLFVILGMVITLSSLTVLETKMNQKTKSSIGAFYNSESGVEWALNKISISSGTISGTLAANSDGSVTCPISPVCKVYFLKSDGAVISKADFSTLTFNDIKAVRSVGTQGTGGTADTQRAIEAAVAGSSGYSFTYMCYSSAWSDSTPQCQDVGGTQKNCPSGYTQKEDLGDWGLCASPGGGWGTLFFMRVPGGQCGAAFGGATADTYKVGYAYICSK